MVIAEPQSTVNQPALSAFIWSVADLVADAARAMDFLKERRAALISAAVTGQIDVRSAIPPARPLSMEPCDEAG